MSERTSGGGNEWNIDHAKDKLVETFRAKLDAADVDVPEFLDELIKECIRLDRDIKKSRAHNKRLALKSKFSEIEFTDENKLRHLLSSLEVAEERLNAFRILQSELQGSDLQQELEPIILEVEKEVDRIESNIESLVSEKSGQQSQADVIDLKFKPRDTI